jgi:TRAP-type C4-dicarboxylate transport system permease small subunit
MAGPFGAPPFHDREAAMSERGTEGGTAGAFQKPPGVWGTIVMLPTWLAAVTLFALMSMTFADVMMRSILNNPIEVASEFTRFFMAIIVFASLPLVSWKSQHIVVDLMDPLFARGLARVRDILLDLVCGAMLLWPAKRVYELAERSAMFGDRTEYLEFPVHYIEYFIAVFTGLTALTFLARGILRIVAPSRIAA